MAYTIKIKYVGGEEEIFEDVEFIESVDGKLRIWFMDETHIDISSVSQTDASKN